MDTGYYARNILIEKQPGRPGTYAILLQSNVFNPAELGTSYVLIGYVNADCEMVQLQDKQARRMGV